MKEKELSPFIPNEVGMKSTDLSAYLPGIFNELTAVGKFTALHTYTSTLNSFTRFWGKKDTAMPLVEVFTPGTLKTYQEWLVRKGLSWNTVSTYMRTLRAIYNRIFSLISSAASNSAPVFYYNPKLFEDVYTRVESRTKRALTEKKTQILMNADLQSLPEKQRRSLAYFRLMFLFRGMPFIDLAHLRKCDLQGNQIVYCRHKTGRQLTVSIPKEAFALIREFRDMNPNSIYLFPILDNSLKDSYAQYRNYLDTLRSFNKYLSKATRILLPGNKVSSYTARHTWATLSFHMGTPVGVISKALGHSSIRVTETYLKPFENISVDRANDKLIALLIQKEDKCRNVGKKLINRFL